MNYLLFPRLIACLFFILPSIELFSAEENFLLIDGRTDEVMLELGPHINQPVSPCSTFKIVLSLMGFDSGVLEDEITPVWEFQEGYDDFLEVWKEPQTPQSWMKYSCVWFSRVLALQLKQEALQNYLTAFEYGNQDISGGLTTSWINSSLKISPKEQVHFIKKMTHEMLPITSKAVEKTKAILYKEELPEEWTLFGKTGWSGSKTDQDEMGWFVGWIEKDNHIFPLAYNVREKKINLAERIPRVKELLMEQKSLGL